MIDREKDYILTKTQQNIVINMIDKTEYNALRLKCNLTLKTVRNNVRKLELIGLLKRTRCGRKILVIITQKGLNIRKYLCEIIGEIKNE